MTVLLNDCVEKKETFLSIKKQSFSKSEKSHFSKGVNPCKKMPISSLFRFGQNKTKNNA